MILYVLLSKGWMLQFSKNAICWREGRVMVMLSSVGERVHVKGLYGSTGKGERDVCVFVCV